MLLTPHDQNLNHGSPGNVIRFGGRCVPWLQTYPRPSGERHGNAAAKLWAMTSPDLETWSEPRLLRVNGPDVPRKAMGRMIDPFLLEDRDKPGKWWCSLKQDGVSMSLSRDVENWTCVGHVSGGENARVLVDRGEHVLCHSPADGIGVKRSRDLKHWRDDGTLFLGRAAWPWAQGRLTAGFVLDLRNDPAIGNALMFFHGSDYPETDPCGGFDNFASIGIAWSQDPKNWAWPKSAPSRP